MYLPKVIYEPLPYLYFCLSGYLIIQEFHWAFAMSGLLFYLAGCVVLVNRSQYRRVDKQRNTLSHYRLPTKVYEYLPFFYIAIAILIAVYVPSPLPQIISVILFVLGLRNLLFRRNNRMKNIS